MHLVCPHCHNPVEVVPSPAPPAEVVCPSCGSSVALDPFLTQPPQSSANRRVGKFELLDLVGTGAFGSVYKARDPDLDRVVALKLPRAGNVGGDGFRERFLREARSAAQLRHPAIVPVHEVGEADGEPYLVSEFVHGVTLADRLSARPIAAKEAARLLAALADALHFAHQNGVVHRDVKPANVMLDAASQPRLMDFGLAKREAGEIAMTVEGQILGTPAYMSPEQAGGGGHAVDGRSDVYSLGVILYQMLAGELPFRGTVRMLLHQVLHDEPRPPRALNDFVPRDLQTVCLKAMAKDPGKRYQTAAELADDLRRFLNGEAIKARPVGRFERAWRWCRRNPALAATGAVAAAALLAVAVVSSVAAVQQYRAAERVRAALDESRLTSATLALQQGQSLCEQGEVGRGLLWVAESLRLAPESAEAFHRVARTNLDGWRGQLRPQRAVLRHGGPMGALAFSPDGRLALTGSHDGTARLWDAATGQPVGEPLPHPAKVEAGGFSPDGATFVVASSETPVCRIWETVTRKLIKEFKGTGTWGGEVAYSPDGKKLATGGPGNALTVRDAATGEPVGEPWPHPAPIAAVAFRPDGQAVAVGCDDGSIHLWDAAGKRLREPMSHPPGIWSLRFFPDGKALVTTSQGDSAIIWDLATGKPRGEPLRHQGLVRPVAVSPDGRTVLTGSTDQTGRLWDAATGKPLGDPLRHAGEVEAVAFSPDGKHCVTGGSDSLVRVWEVATGRPVGAAVAHSSPVHAARWSPDGRTLAVSGWDGIVRLWEARPFKTDGIHIPHGAAAQTVGLNRNLGVPLPHGSAIQTIGFSPDGATALTGGADRMVRLWNAATGEALGEPLEHPHWVYDAAFSPDGRSLLVGIRKGGAILWDVAARKPRGEALAHTDLVWSVDISPDGKTLATASGDGTARLWDADTRQVRAVLEHKGEVYSVRFSHDGTKVATASEDGTARIWNAVTGKPLTPPLGHDAAVQTAAFSPTSGVLLTASWDRTARLWDTTTGEPRGDPLVHPDRVLAVAFSPEGDRFATASSHFLRLYDTASRKQLRAPMAHLATVNDVAFLPDGKAIATASSDKSAVLWDVATGMRLGPPVRHDGLVLRVALRPGGGTLLSAGGGSTAWLTPVPEPLPGDIDRLSRWLEAVTGQAWEDGSVGWLDKSKWQPSRSAEP